MNLMDHFHRQLEYDAWANREVLLSLKALSEPPADGVRLLNHVIAAEHVWLSRLEGTAPPFAVWPEIPLAQCEQELQQLHRDYRAYFERALPRDLDRVVTYKNSKGEDWTSRIDDILTHVFLHSTYHRGQIALQMRKVGHAPAYTDFIHGIRQGLVK